MYKDKDHASVYLAAAAARARAGRRQSRIKRIIFIRDTSSAAHTSHERVNAQLWKYFSDSPWSACCQIKTCEWDVLLESLSALLQLRRGSRDSGLWARDGGHCTRPTIRARTDRPHMARVHWRRRNPLNTNTHTHTTIVCCRYGCVSVIQQEFSLYHQ